MPELIHKQVEFAPRIGIPEVVREFNLACRRIAQAVTQNWRESYPQVDSVFIVNTTQLVWLPLEQYRVEWIALKTSSGTASVTPRIDATAMGVTGGTPITATTTATRYSVTSDNLVPEMSYVDAIVSGMGPGANMVMSLGVRRLR